MVLESTVQRAILKFLNTIPNSDWVKPTTTNKAGWPDISGHIDGAAIFIEVKKDDKTKPSKIQEHVIDKLNRNGAIAFPCGSVGKCRENLRRWFLDV